MDSVFADFARAMDELVKNVEDPAKAVAFCVRHSLLRARREPVWGKFLLRDILRGAAAGRFKAPDLVMSFVAVGSTVLGAIAAEQRSSSLNGPQSAPLRKMGLNLDNIVERATATTMTILGLSQKEAESIARLPLPGPVPAKGDRAPRRPAAGTPPT